MASKTLLALTQDILTAMEDDEVNSIADTVSSMSVATTIRNCFDELVSQLDLSGSNALVRLEPLSDVTKPNYLFMPDEIKRMLWLRYNDKEVCWLDPGDFVRFVIQRDTGTLIEDFNGVSLKIDTSKDPDYWTSFDDKYLVFDSYNNSDGSTLIGSKSMAYVVQKLNLPLVDTAVPELPESILSTLLSKATARCFINFKQVSNAAEERAERHGLIRHQNDQFRHNNRKPYNRAPDYGKPRR